MKKLLLVFAIVSLFSCQKDEVEPTAKTAQIENEIFIEINNTSKNIIPISLYYGDQNYVKQKDIASYEIAPGKTWNGAYPGKSEYRKLILKYDCKGDTITMKTKYFKSEKAFDLYGVGTSGFSLD